MIKLESPPPQYSQHLENLSLKGNLAQLLNLPSTEDFDVAPIEEVSATPAALEYDGVVERWPSILAAKSLKIFNSTSFDVYL